MTVAKLNVYIKHIRKKIQFTMLSGRRGRETEFHIHRNI